MDTDRTVNVVGAGLSGLSAALSLASKGFKCNLISSMPSERAQSVLAEGGINAALDTMGENDTEGEHFNDTMKGGCYIESESAVRNLTYNAPDVVRSLVKLGVPFQSESGRLILRNFGGQPKKRTAYAKSSTGKMIMTALIAEVRKYEETGFVVRYPHHELTDMTMEDGRLISITVRDNFTGEYFSFSGCTILCTGGMNGFFEGMTTGTTQDTGNAAAVAFSRGVCFTDLEFIQYHPTTVQICDKRMLISEAARGEGGRLFALRDSLPWYFMEEKYPQLGNLMPRDVISREMAFIQRDLGDDVIYLDLRGLDDKVWENRLSDMRDEIMSYLHTDPKEKPIPVSPGIHYFMGGIRVNDRHQSSVKGLYAAGEAAGKYHGANRLGGNSMLGAIFGGRVAAENASLEAGEVIIERTDKTTGDRSSFALRKELEDILLSGLGIIRESSEMGYALEKTEDILKRDDIPVIDRYRTLLGRAMLLSAIGRKESRGAHYRKDYPESSDDYKKISLARYVNGDIKISFTEASSEVE